MISVIRRGVSSSGTTATVHVGRFGFLAPPASFCIQAVSSDLLHPPQQSCNCLGEPVRTDAVLMVPRHQAIAERSADTFRLADYDAGDFVALFHGFGGRAVCRRRLGDHISMLLGYGPTRGRNHGLPHSRRAMAQAKAPHRRAGSRHISAQEHLGTAGVSRRLHVGSHHGGASLIHLIGTSRAAA
jgi:hypothetical protein